jgi:hypothetical protein
MLFGLGFKGYTEYVSILIAEEIINMLILKLCYRVMKVPCLWRCAPIVSSIDHWYIL